MNLRNTYFHVEIYYIIVRMKPMETPSIRSKIRKFFYLLNSGLEWKK